MGGSPNAPMEARGKGDWYGFQVCFALRRLLRRIRTCCCFGVVEQQHTQEWEL